MSLEDSSIHDDCSMGLNEGAFVLPNDSDLLQTIENEEEMLLNQIGNIGCPNIEENARRVLFYMSKNVDNELQNVSLMDYINNTDNTTRDLFLQNCTNTTANEFGLCDIPLKLADPEVQEEKTNIHQVTDCGQNVSESSSFHHDNDCIENEDEDVDGQPTIWDNFVEKVIITRYKCKLCTFHAETLLEVQAHLISTHIKPSLPATNSSKDDLNSISAYSPEAAYSDDCSEQQQKPAVKSKRVRKENSKAKLKVETTVFISTRKRRRGKNKRIRYACDWQNCDYMGSDSRQLQDHRRIHTGEKPFRCDWIDCGMSFNQASTLRTHSRTHTGEKPFPCTYPMCGKAFSQRSNLKAHLVRHAGVKPFPCSWPDCNQRFTSKAHLENHVNAIHQKHKPFACDFPGCTARYTVNSHLRFHKLVHQEGKAIACDWPDCQYRCHRKFDMKLHKLTHVDGGKNYACKLCPKTYTRPSHLSTHIKSAHSKSQADGVPIAITDSSGNTSNAVLATTIIEPSAEEQES